MKWKSIVLLCVLACNGCIRGGSVDPGAGSDRRAQAGGGDGAYAPAFSMRRKTPAIDQPALSPAASKRDTSFRFERVIVGVFERDWFPEHVVVGDVTGDALLDIVMSMSPYANNGSVLVRVYAQRPDGELATPIEFKVERALNATHAIELADLNGDGVKDIAVIDNTGLTTFSWINGAFVTRWQPSSGRYSALATVDANGDGRMDVFAQASEYGSRFFLGDGRGGFSAVQPVDTGNRPHAVLDSTDFTADGWPDLMVSDNGAYEVRIYPFVPGIGLLSQPFIYDVRQVQGVSYGAAAGDLDRDGRPDLVISDRATHGVSNTRGVRVLYRGTGDDFTRSTFLATPGYYTYPGALAVADLDKNGYRDIVVMFDSNDSFGYFLQGPAGFAPVVTVYTDDNPYTNNTYRDNTFAIADINSDLCPDLVLAEASSTLQIFRGKNCQIRRMTGGPLRLVR